MAKPILIKPSNELSKQIKDAAQIEKRKPGPMVLILLERYFASLAIANKAPDAPKVPDATTL